MPAAIDQQRLAQDLVEQARAEGLQLVSADGLLTGLTKSVLEAALEAEMSEHLGYDKHDAAGRNGGNSRNGTRTKTVLTAVGPVQVEVARDRDGSFEPVIVRKRHRRTAHRHARRGGLPGAHAVAPVVFEVVEERGDQRPALPVGM